MAKIKKSFRFDEDTVSLIEAIASRDGISQADAISVAVAAYGRGTDEGSDGDRTASDGALGAVEALASQLSVKDRQIEVLGEALKAAQALNAASIRTPSLPGLTEDEAEARADAAVAAERERIRSLSPIARLCGWI